MSSSEKPPVHSSAWIVFPPINAAHICLVYSLNSMRSTHSLATFHTSGLQNPVVDPRYFEKLWTTTKIKVSNDDKNLTIFNSGCDLAQPVMHKPLTMEAWI